MRLSSLECIRPSYLTVIYYKVISVLIAATREQIEEMNVLRYS